MGGVELRASMGEQGVVALGLWEAGFLVGGDFFRQKIRHVPWEVN